MIKQLPNRYNMFIEKGFAMYVLDDCSVHLIPEVRLHIRRKLRIWSHLLKKPLMENFIFHAVALFKKGTFLLLMVVASLVICRSMTQAVITI